MGPGGGSATFGFESGPVGGICFSTREACKVVDLGNFARRCWGRRAPFHDVRLCPPGYEADLPTPDATGQAWGWRGQPWTHAGEPLSARALGSRARDSPAGWLAGALPGGGHGHCPPALFQQPLDPLAGLFSEPLLRAVNLSLLLVQGRRSKVTGVSGCGVAGRGSGDDRRRERGDLRLRTAGASVIICAPGSRCLSVRSFLPSRAPWVRRLL